MIIPGRKKQTLTLLELFFCLGILAAVGSLLILKAQPMIAHYRFKSGVSRLVNELEWSYKVAMSACADIDFTIQQQGKKLICKRSTDEPFTFGEGNRTFKIDHIPCFLFDGEEKQILKLTFTRSSFIFPAGKLTLYSSKKKDTCSEIFLPPLEKSHITATN